MIAWLAAALLASLASEVEPVFINLDHFMDQAEAMDGRLVEFDAYVRLMGTQNSSPVLSALSGEYVTLQNGRRVTICVDNPEAHVAVLLAGNGFGPLSPRAARPRNAYVGVLIRGILRNRSHGFRAGNFEHEWVGSVDHARIVRVTGGRCLINLPR